MESAVFLISDRATASHANICFAQRFRNQKKQFNRSKNSGDAWRASNQQDLNIQRGLSDCDGA
jgi:hypothetical protein